jgi:hypothetical protein
MPPVSVEPKSCTTLDEYLSSKLATSSKDRGAVEDTNSEQERSLLSGNFANALMKTGVVITRVSSF